MRKLHLDSRKYNQPLTLIVFEDEYENGIKTQTIFKEYNLWGSIMQVYKQEVSTNERATNQKLSILIPNPPFIIENEKTKVVINHNLYSIINVDFNQLTRNEIKIEAIFESKYDKNR